MEFFQAFTDKIIYVLKAKGCLSLFPYFKDMIPNIYESSFCRKNMFKCQAPNTICDF